MNQGCYVLGLVRLLEWVQKRFIGDYRSVVLYLEGRMS